MRWRKRAISDSGARDGDEDDVTLCQVHGRAVGVVGHIGAILAALLPARSEHEVLHQQLAVAVEQIGQRAPAHRRVERVGLVDPHAGQRPALACDLVTEAGQLLLARKQRLTLGDPLVPGYDAMVWGAHLGNGGSAGYVCFHRLGSFLRLSIRFSTLIGRSRGSLWTCFGKVESSPMS